MTLMTLILMTAPTAFAGTGSGAVSCTTRTGDVVALYKFFNSSADSYASANVFVANEDGTFQTYSAEAGEALRPISVQTDDGRTISIDAQVGGCTVRVE